MALFGIVSLGCLISKQVEQEKSIQLEKDNQWHGYVNSDDEDEQYSETASLISFDWDINHLIKTIYCW